MIICCEQCNTEFNVPESVIGIEGRAVRCSRCSHEWIAYNPISEHQKETSAPLTEPRYAYIFIKLGALASFLFLIVSLLVYYYNPSSINHAVKLQVVNCAINNIQSVDDLVEVQVAVSIANTSDKEQLLPQVRFSVFDIDKNFVGELTVLVNTIIPAGQNTKVEGKLSRVPKNSHFVGIDIGNKFDIYMRESKRLFSLIN